MLAIFSGLIESDERSLLSALTFVLPMLFILFKVRWPSKLAGNINKITKSKLLMR